MLCIDGLCVKLHSRGTTACSEAAVARYQQPNRHHCLLRHGQGAAANAVYTGKPVGLAIAHNTRVARMVPTSLPRSRLADPFRGLACLDLEAVIHPQPIDGCEDDPASYEHANNQVVMVPKLSVSTPIASQNGPFRSNWSTARPSTSMLPTNSATRTETKVIVML
jgi:hypothetical protein